MTRSRSARRAAVTSAPTAHLGTGQRSAAVLAVLEAKREARKEAQEQMRQHTRKLADRIALLEDCCRHSHNLQRHALYLLALPPVMEAAVGDGQQSAEDVATFTAALSRVVSRLEAVLGGKVDTVDSDTYIHVPSHSRTLAAR